MLSRRIRSLVFVLVLCSTHSHGQYIYHIAGNDSCGYKDGPSFHSSFRQAGPICRDKNGNLFIADMNNARIRKLDASNNMVTTLAGNPHNYADTVDNIPATDAFLIGIGGMCVDAAGNLLFTDGRSRIKKIDLSTGVITTVAGSPIPGYSGDGGPVTAALLGTPASLIIDNAGNLYFSQPANNAVRKITASTGIINTIAGGNLTGTFGGDGGPASAASLYNPNGLTLDGAGNLFICDRSNYRIRKVDATTGIITTVAGNGSMAYSGNGGPATAAGIYHGPNSIATDSHGNLYIAENPGRVRRVDAATGIITTYAGTGGGSSLIDSAGDGGPATAAQVNHVSLCLDTCDNLFMASDYCRIRVVTNNHPVNGRLCGLLVSGVESPANPAKEELTTWPNPSYGTFTINLSSPLTQEAHVTITDLTGRLVKEVHCPTNKDTELHINTGPGLYLLTAETEYDRYVRKVIVEH